MNKAKHYARLAGFACIGAFALDLLKLLVQGSVALTGMNLLWWTFLVFTGVLLLLNSRSRWLAAGAGVNTLRTVYGACASWNTTARSSYIDKLFVVCNILAAFTLFVLLTMSLSGSAKVRKVARRVWFVPGVILALRYAPVWVTFNYPSLTFASALGILGQAAHLAAFFLIGAMVMNHRTRPLWTQAKARDQEGEIYDPKEEDEQVEWEEIDWK
ncbi:MAG: hypothetical protein IJR17_04435 [Clostridia bacterium]|nr:hypothetical protein [Clostridia bacterium]